MTKKEEKPVEPEEPMPSEVHEKEALAALNIVPNEVLATTRAYVYALLSISAAVRELADVVALAIEE